MPAKLIVLLITDELGAVAGQGRTDAMIDSLVGKNHGRCGSWKLLEMKGDHHGVDTHEDGLKQCMVLDADMNQTSFG
eukprot:2401955-Karenia_brevis.AAC.1